MSECPPMLNGHSPQVPSATKLTPFPRVCIGIAMLSSRESMLMTLFIALVSKLMAGVVAVEFVTVLSLIVTQVVIPVLGATLMPTEFAPGPV